MLRRRRHLHCLTLRNFRLRTAKRLVYGAIAMEYNYNSYSALSVRYGLKHSTRPRALRALGPRAVFEPYRTLSVL